MNYAVQVSSLTEFKRDLLLQAAHDLDWQNSTCEGQSITMSDHEEVFHPEDAIAKSIHATTITGGAGLLLAAVQNTVARENIGAFGVFTRFGGTIALFGMNILRSYRGTF